MEAYHILMDIWKEAIHGNRHADKDADYRALHTKRISKRVVFCGKT